MRSESEKFLDDCLGTEGVVGSIPRLARNRPAERAARRKVLESKLREAHAKVFFDTIEPFLHGRCCLVGLVVINVLRMLAWWQGSVPGWSVFGMHFLTTSSDVAVLACAVPLFATGTRGQCVQLGCLGPMLTLVFAMCMVDLSALGAYLVVATPRPLAAGDRSLLTMMEAVIGVWEFALVASVALQMALCSSSWRVYKALRTVGLYPPGGDPANVGEPREISVMEVMCEAEDVELLADCEAMGAPFLCLSRDGHGCLETVSPVPATASASRAQERNAAVIRTGIEAMNGVAVKPARIADGNHGA